MLLNPPTIACSFYLPESPYLVGPSTLADIRIACICSILLLEVHHTWIFYWGAHLAITLLMDASNSLRRQTDVAYARKQSHGQAVQDSFYPSADADSSCASSPIMSPSQPASDTLDFVRCSRCQRSLSTSNASPAWNGVVRIGINSYYCNRCATLVGYKG